MAARLRYRRRHQSQQKAQRPRSSHRSVRDTMGARLCVAQYALIGELLAEKYSWTTKRTRVRHRDTNGWQVGIVAYPGQAPKSVLSRMITDVKEQLITYENAGNREKRQDRWMLKDRSTASKSWMREIRRRYLLQSSISRSGNQDLEGNRSRLTKGFFNGRERSTMVRKFNDHFKDISMIMMSRLPPRAAERLN